MLDFEIQHLGIFRDDLFQHGAQPRYVPLLIPQAVKELVLGFLAAHAKGFQEGRVGIQHFQMVVEDHERFAHGIQNLFHELLRLLEPLAGFFGLVNIRQHNDSSVNLIVRGAIRPNLQRIPMFVFILHLQFYWDERADYTRNQSIQVWHLDIRTDIRNGAAYIGRKYSKDLCRSGSQAPDEQTTIHHHNGQTRAGKEVVQVTTRPVELQIAIAEFIIDGV